MLDPQTSGKEWVVKADGFERQREGLRFPALKPGSRAGWRIALVALAFLIATSSKPRADTYEAQSMHPDDVMCLKGVRRANSTCCTRPQKCGQGRSRVAVQS